MTKEILKVGEIVEVYLRSVLASRPPKWIADGEVIKITPTGRATIRYQNPSFSAPEERIFDPEGHVYGGPEGGQRFRRKI